MRPWMKPLIEELVLQPVDAGRTLLAGLVRLGVCRSAGLAWRAPEATHWRTTAELDPRRELQDPNALHPVPDAPLPTALPADRLLLRLPTAQGELLLQLAGWDAARAPADELEGLLPLLVVLEAPLAGPAAPLPDVAGRSAPTRTAALDLLRLWEDLGAALEPEDRAAWARATRATPRPPAS